MKLTPKPKHLIGVPAKRRRGEKFAHDPGATKPTDYRPEYCGAILRYFAETEAWDINYTDKGAGQCLPKGKLPTMERFALSIGVTTRTLTNWKDTFPEFADAYADALALQKAFIMEAGGVTVNAGFATFLLKCNHGMREPETPKEAGTLEEQLSKLIDGMPS